MMPEGYPHPEPKAKKDFFAKFNALVDAHLPKLNKSETHVLLKMMRWSSADWLTFKSAEKIAEELNCSLRNVYAAIGKLKRLKMIRVASEGGGRDRFTVYRIIVPKTVQNPSLFEKGNSEDSFTNTVKNRALNSEESCALLNKDEEKLEEKYEEKKARGKPSAVSLPPNLQTDRFKEAWASWTKYRREARKPLTPSTEKLQLVKLEQAGEPAAIDAIHASISNGWQGLFPKGTPNADESRRSKTLQRRNDEFPEPEIVIRGLERAATRD